MAWRPDGKVLAVGYADGIVELYDVESSVPILTNRVNHGLTFMRWTACPESGSLPSNGNKDWDFLIQFPSLSKAFSYNPSNQEDVQNCRKLSLETSHSILICGTDKGTVSFFMSGFMAIGFININRLYNISCSIKEVILSPKSLSSLSVMALVDDMNDNVLHLSFSGFPLLSSCFTELCTLADRQSILIGTLDYMADTLKQISEGWEQILQEMDNKLHAYAKQMPDHHGMAADFLELLMLGTPSPELDRFLMQELGEKGLKKLGHSIEVSYSNMQRLVLKYLHTVSQAINFHLAEMIGQVKASDKYETVLNFSCDSIRKAQVAASVFWAKGIELQQVIDESMKCFKAFFRWLYVEILRLSEESVSEDLSKASQQDVEFIADFLSTFSKANVKDDSYTYLERVGQYMKNEALLQPVDRSRNLWHVFLKENPQLKDIPEILVVDEKASLMQAFERLKESIIETFEGLDTDLTENCLPQGSLVIHGNQDSQISVVGQTESSEESKVFGHVMWSNPSCESSKSLFLEYDPSKKSLRALGLVAGPFNNTTFHLVSESFYTCDTMSVLVTSIEGHRLIQVPVSPIEHYMTPISISNLCATQIASLEDPKLKTMSIFSIAGPVSTPRLFKKEICYEIHFISRLVIENSKASIQKYLPFPDHGK